MKRIGVWVPFILACGLATILAAALLLKPGAVDPMVGKARPILDLTALDVSFLEPAAGTAQTGQVQLVNFWASWCAPCIAEHPQLMQLAREGVMIDGYIYRDDPEKARAVLAAAGNPYRVSYLDPDGVAMMAYGTKGVPESFVIDKNGNITLRITGIIDQAVLNDVVRPALVKASQAR